LVSYASPLIRNGLETVTQVAPNTTLVYSISELVKLQERPVWNFSLDQYKDSWDGWKNAFQNAIRKRTRAVKHGVFIGLSSGYDSGAVACELMRPGVPFTAYSIVGFENPETIQLRHMRLQNPEYIELNHEGFIIARKHLKTNCEEYALRIDNGEQEQLDILRDQYWSTCSELNELESTWEELKEPEFTGQVRKNKNRKAIFEKRMSRIKEVIDFRRTRQMTTVL
jgi:hypothetical protein